MKRCGFPNSSATFGLIHKGKWLGTPMKCVRSVPCRGEQIACIKSMVPDGNILIRGASCLFFKRTLWVASQEKPQKYLVGRVFFANLMHSPNSKILQFKRTLVHSNDPSGNLSSNPLSKGPARARPPPPPPPPGVGLPLAPFSPAPGKSQS